MKGPDIHFVAFWRPAPRAPPRPCQPWRRTALSPAAGYSGPVTTAWAPLVKGGSGPGGAHRAGRESKLEKSNPVTVQPFSPANRRRAGHALRVPAWPHPWTLAARIWAACITGDSDSCAVQQQPRSRSHDAQPPSGKDRALRGSSSHALDSDDPTFSLKRRLRRDMCTWLVAVAST